MRSLVVVLLSAVLVGLTPAPARAAAAPVTKRLAVVVIQNGDTDTERTQLADTTFLRNIFFGSSGSLASWMPAVTHGLLSYAPAGAGVFLATPTAELVNADKKACHSNLARTNAESHLTSIGVGWDAVAVVYDIAGCTWAGLGQVPGKVTWYPPRPSLSAIVHEFGHNLGYPHQAKRDCVGGLISNCKANDYSGNTPMGSGGSGKGYSSIEMLHSGWVEPGWLTQTSKPGTFSLKPLHSAASVTGTRVVEFKTASNLSYVIETRAASSTVDTAITNPGVRVYAVTGKDFKGGYLVNPGAATSAPYLKAGGVITDAANKVTITVKSSSATGAQVAIEAIVPPAKPSPSASVTASPSPSPVAVPSESGEPIPDTIDDFDLTDTAAVPSSSPPLKWWWLAIAGTLIVLGAVGLLTRRLVGPRSRHRRPWFS